MGRSRLVNCKKLTRRDFRTASPDSVLFDFSTMMPDLQTAIGVLKSIGPIRRATSITSSTGGVVVEVTYKDPQHNAKAI